VPNQRPDRRADLTGPRQQAAREPKLEDAVGAKDELELALWALAALALGERVQLAAVVHPRRQRLVRKHQLLLDAELVRDADDRRLRRKGVWAILPDEAVLLVRDDVATHVVARLGEQHVRAAAVQVVRQRRARDAGADDDAVNAPVDGHVGGGAHERGRRPLPRGSRGRQRPLRREESDRQERQHIRSPGEVEAS